MRKSETYEFTPVEQLDSEADGYADQDYSIGDDDADNSVTDYDDGTVDGEGYTRRTGWSAEPTVGEFQLDERSALRRVAGLSTELTDITEVEYRQLRLERVVLVGVWTEGSSAQADASMAELAALAETAGSQVLDALIQRRDKPDPATYIGSGKADELRAVVLHTGADTVICDGELTPAQLNALEKVVKVKVIDRTALILDIFAQHATSREGKAQVSLAQMEYMLPRLRGWGESMSRQAGGRAGGAGGGVGTRGPGETKIETDRRRIRERMAKLRREIKEMKTARDTKRSRRTSSGIPAVAIVGYTNAGKSSLMNALTGAGILVQDALFATLDPTTRRAALDDGREVVFTDTVGFVRHLPTQLVEAFRSTLEEVTGADLLLHVVDGSDALPDQQIKAVREVITDVLREQGAQSSGPPELLVVNKIDALDRTQLAHLRAQLPDAVFVSARTGYGIDRLRDRLAEILGGLDVEVSVLLPYTRGDLLARIHSDGRIISSSHEEGGTRVRARVPRALAPTLSQYAHASTVSGAEAAGPSH
ncbi:GTPase HflX [Nocardia spumae]|uniref:GTPase HflX n=1 Tax=Nocardia spumae TaxID=2887190 RepID=UPI001D154E76|nr:GTPase HflX [Nocardia spumae]